MSIIEAEMEATPERDEIIDFIRNSSRGVMKGYQRKLLVLSLISLTIELQLIKIKFNSNQNA